MITWQTLQFLLMVVMISASGVMAPGPVTTATIAAGTRSPHAGALIALGHGLVEFPLMFLILLGMDKILAHRTVQLAIGLAGGAFLLILGLLMLRDFLRPDYTPHDRPRRNALWTGVVLTAGNPFFLLWWATVGLTLATQASRLGHLAFVLFTVLHWLCDLLWLDALSWASFKGAALLGPANQLRVLLLCSIALLLFAARFLFIATANLLLNLTTPS